MICSNTSNDDELAAGAFEGFKFLLLMDANTTDNGIQEGEYPYPGLLLQDNGTGVWDVRVVKRGSEILEIWLELVSWFDWWPYLVW